MIHTYYINPTPVNSNYGNPSSRGEIALPDEFLDKYISAKGFIIPTISNGVVVSLEVNQDALDAYNREHPDAPPEPTLETLTEMEMQDYLADLDLRVCLLELGLSEEDIV